MTQAFNLSQLANKVNSSGQLDASTGLVNATPIVNGGTNNAALAVTAGGVIYSDGSKLVNVGAGISGQALTSQGSSPPVWANAASYLGPNFVYFSTSSSWTVPAGITNIVVNVVGGGGGSGAAQFSTNYGGRGGTGGKANAYITTASGTYTITIGAAGLGATSLVTGGAGGMSSFGSAVSATGGGGGLSQTTNNGGVGADGTPTISVGVAISGGFSPSPNPYGTAGAQVGSLGAFIVGNNGIAGAVWITW